jgi:hypothetical protein
MTRHRRVKQRRLLVRWVSHPGADFAIIAVAVGAFELAVAAGVDPLSDFGASTRVVMYQTLAALAAAILGFSIAAVAIVATLTPRRRVQYVMKVSGTHIVRALMGCLAGFAVAAFGFVILMLFDAGERPSAARYLALALFVLLALRVARLIYIIGRLLTAMSLDAADEGEPAEPEWQRPTITASDYALPTERADSA